MSNDKNSSRTTPLTNSSDRPPLRRRPSDPFSRKSENENFPGLDKAFLDAVHVDDTPKMGSSSKRYSPRSSSFEREQSFSLDQHSICSHPSEANSSLDMSIGARAALTEHLRHIARYGLDGQEETNQKEEPTERSELDEEWDRLMDGGGNTSVASWSTAPPNNNNDTASIGPGMFNLAPVYTVQEDGNESVEIVVSDVDTSSDYFNSSLVQCLATPEKNKNQKLGVTQRETTEERHPLFSSFEGEADGEESVHSQETGTMIHMFQAAMGIGQATPPRQHLPDSSFASFAADVSRISASFDDEEESSLKNDMFQQQRDATTEVVSESADIRDFVPPIEQQTSFGACTPIRRRSPPRSNFQRDSPTKSSRRCDKENEIPNISSLALSPIAAQAGNEAGRILRETTSGHFAPAPFLDSASPIKKCRTPPNRLFGDNSESSRIQASPISKAPSLLSYFSSTNSKKSKGANNCRSPRLQPKRCKARSSIVAGIEEYDVSPLSKDEEVHNCRQEFKTVIPSAQDDQDDEFLEHNERVSSTPSPRVCATRRDSDEEDSNPDTSRRSLLESFEAAYRDEPLSS